MGCGGKGKGLNKGSLSQLWHLCSGQSEAEWNATQAIFYNLSLGKGKGKGQESQGYRGKGVYVQPAAWPIPEPPEDGGWIRARLAKPVVMGPNGKPDTMTHPNSGQTVTTAYLCHMCFYKHCSHNRSHCANPQCGVKRDRSKEPLSVTKKGNVPPGPPGPGTKGGRVNPTLVPNKNKPKAAGQGRSVQYAEPSAAMEVDQEESLEAFAYIPPTLLKPGNLRSCVEGGIPMAIAIDRNNSKGATSGTPDIGPQRVAQLARLQKRLKIFQEHEDDFGADEVAATVAEIASLQEVGPPTAAQEQHILAECMMIQATHSKDMALAATVFKKADDSLMEEMATLQTKIANLKEARCNQLAIDTQFAAALLIRCGMKEIAAARDSEANEALPTNEAITNLLAVIQPELEAYASTMALLPEHVAKVMTGMQTILAKIHRGPDSSAEATRQATNGVGIPAGTGCNGEEQADGSSS